jgi:GAF domain-containing protein/anti-sigma regulatory factor (Ser/Thr protein kinase)
MADIGPALLETLLALSPATLYVLDEDLRVRWTSAAHSEETSDGPLGRYFAQACRLDDSAGAERHLRQALNEPSPVRERTFRGHRSDGSGPDRGLSLSARSLADLGGSSAGLLVVVEDVTERDQAQRREAALDAVRDGVGRSLDVAVTCRSLAESLVPGFADIAVVDVWDEVLRGAEPPAAPPGRDVPLRCAAFRSSVAETVPASPEGEVRDTPSRTPQARALSDLQPRLAALDQDAAWLTADPAQARLVAAAGAHSLIVAPLTLRGAVLGLMSLYRCGAADPYEEPDIPVVVSLAAHAVLSLDNARRYERDHTIASTVQRRLLPQRATSTPALETAHVHLPGSNSGCWFDTIALPGARTALVVGNVAGSGIQTAATMGQLRMVINALADLDLEPDELLARLNDTAAQLTGERAALPAADAAHRQPITASCLYGVYDPFARTCTLARAGHPAPLVVHPDGSTSTADLPDGPGLGSSEPFPFASTVLPLEEGCLLAFRTGAFVKEGAHLDDPVRRALAHPDRRLDELCDAAVYALPQGGGPDGAVLLLARTGAVPADRVAAVELPHDPTSPARARAAARARLDSWKVDEDASYAAELIVSELVTNAVRYGTPPVRLRLIRTHTLTCEVHDTGVAAPHLRHARTVDEGGRGLFIVSQLATRWGTRYTPTGKILWTEQPLTAAD